MSVTEVLGGLGSWGIRLEPSTPPRIVDAIGFFGHFVVVDGQVDLEATGDAILSRARYVGVLRDKSKDDEGGYTLGGSGLTFWLGDEDEKGEVVEASLTFTSRTLAQAVTDLIDPMTSLNIGTIHPQPIPAARYSGVHQFQTPRRILQSICDAFGVEFRVNGNGTVDVGSVAQLYGTTITSIISRRGAGSDADGLRSLGADFDLATTVKDYTTRVVLLGQTLGLADEPDVTFVTGDAQLPEVPYRNLLGSVVKMTRLISESGETEGSVAARAGLHLNRFGRIVRALDVTAEDYETEGSFRVGQRVYIYDPEAGVFDTATERMFQGQAIHPDVTRVTEATWQPVRGQKLAFRTDTGVWLDLSPFVTYETGADTLVVGDLPRSLTASRDSVIQGRLDAVRASTPDGSVPNPPTGLTLSSDAYIGPSGATLSVILAEWDAPTTNEDGSTLTDLDHYLVESRWTGRNVFSGSVYTSDTMAELFALEPNLPYEVQVRAVDNAGNVSAPVTATITTAADDLPPEAPAAPVASTFLGQLRLDWPGVGAGGNKLARDTKNVHIHIGVPGFTPVLANRIDSLAPFGPGTSIYSWPTGVPYEVVLIAEDQTGNFSPPSERVSGTTTKLGDGEIGQLSVSHLISGRLDAVVVVGNRIISSPTGATTGQRTEMAPSGWRAFDSNENQTLNLDGENNLLTGKFTTGMPGQRRIEIEAIGGFGVLRFIAPDGVVGELRGFTTSTDPVQTATTEAIQMVVPVLGADGRWNAISVEREEEAWMVSKMVQVIFGSGGSAGAGKFSIESTTNRGNVNDLNARRVRYIIEAGGQEWRNAGGSYNQRIGIYPVVGQNNRSEDSPVMVWTSGYNFGAGLKFYSDAAGNGAALQVVTPDGNQWHNIQANAFLPPSDEVLKDDISTVPDVLSELRSSDLRPVTYTLKGEARTGRRKGTTTAKLSPGQRGAHRFGLIAQEVPDRMKVQVGELLSLDLASGLAYALGGLKELDAIVSEMKARLDRGDKK